MYENLLLNKKKYVAYKDPVVIALLLFLILFLFGFGFLSRYNLIYVIGDSMLPTLTGAPSEDEAGGDYLFVDTSAEPEHGDIVVAYAGVNGSQHLIIKRVIACGGDKIYIDSGAVYIIYAGDDDCTILEEDYVAAENNDYDFFLDWLEIPEGEYFLMGDNRINSDDSRNKYGTFDEDDIVGVVTAWSLSAKSYITAFYTFFTFGVTT